MCMNVQALTLLYSVLPYCIMVALQKNSNLVSQMNHGQ